MGPEPSSTNVDSFAVSAGAGSATINNYAAGFIKGSATGTGAATGLYGSGSVTINDNAGSIMGTSTRGIGYGVYASSSDLTVTSNSGSITGLSTFSSSNAAAYGLIANASSVTVGINTGTISGSASGSGAAYGAYAGTSASITNTGPVSEISGLASGSGAAYGVYVFGSTATINSNDGAIYGSSGTGAAYGVYSSGSASDIIVVSNANDIHGSNNAIATRAAGLYAAASNVTIGSNTGDIYGTSTGGFAYGVYGGNSASVTNSGAISGTTAGVYAFYADATLTNTGTGAVTAQATGSGAAYGVYAGGMATVDNAATSSITATASGGGDAYGIQASGDITLINDGHMTAVASTGSSYGVYGVFGGGGTVTVTNSGIIEASSQRAAYGVFASTANVNNSGSITAASSAGGASFGISGYDAAVTNSGTISATNGANGEATGVYGSSTATVSNAANKTIAAYTHGSNAWGVRGLLTATVTSNGGTISATTNGAGAAYGVASDSSGDMVVTSNAGTITATASGTGAAYGLYGDNSATVTSNAGTLSATSGTGAAFGVYAAGAAQVTNTGGISASSSGGDAWGVYGGSDFMANLANLGPGTRADATLDNSLSVNASTSGTGNAYGLYGGTWAHLTNRAGATLSAVATGSGAAYAVKSNDATTTISNSGVISATSGTGLSYGLYLGGGATTVTNSGSITAGTAGIYAGAAITTLRNYQGGSGTSPTTTALTYRGVLPTNYYIYVTSATHYGQVQFTNPTGSMAVVVDTTSLALGRYQNVMQGVAATAFTGGSGSLGLMKWALSLSNPTSLAWDLVVTPVGVDPNTTKPASGLGVTFLPIFTGGTLQVDQTAHTYGDNFTVDNAPTNKIDLAGKRTTFSGVFSDASTNGAIAFTGAETAIVTGNNTYTGATSIDTGTTVQIGDGGTLGALGAGAVTNNGTLAINRSDNVTIANAIAGAGAFTKSGAGVLTLTGANAYAGPTTISAGTLEIGDGGTYGSLGAGAVTNNGTLAFNRSDNITVANAIAGAGAFRKSGAGVVTLTGANAYVGTTTITAGTLEIGGGGASGSLGAGAVTNNGTLAFNRSDNITVANAITGAGAFRKSGAGVLTLTGANNYMGATTINAGTLQIGDGGTVGALGAGDVTNNGTLAINRLDNVTVANAISGGGAVNINGSGVTTLSGVNTFSGGLVVNSGAALAISSSAALGSGILALVGSPTVPATLKVTGTTTISNALTVSGDPVFDIAPGTTTTITSPIINGAQAGDVVVQGGGTLALTAINTYTGLTSVAASTTLALQGAGAIANSVSVANNGVLDLTGRSGPTQMGGAFTQSSTGSLLMTMTANGPRSLTIAGAAAIDGALTLTAAPGAYRSGTYHLLTAGSLSGTFSSVSTNMASFARLYSLSYTSTTVDLTLVNGPDSANTTRALTANGANLRNLMVQRTAALAGMMDYDCPSFDQYGVCLGFQARYSGMETLHDGAGVLTAAARLSPHLRLGGFIDQGATRNMPTGLRQNAQPPSFGAFLGFNQRTDGLGLQGRISAAMNRGDLRVTRDVSLENVEAGDGKARLAGSAVAAELGYAVAWAGALRATPYVGLRYTNVARAAYEEKTTPGAVDFPIAYAALRQQLGAATMGLRLSGMATDRIGYQIGAGMEYDIWRSMGAYAGAAPIFGLETFALPLADAGRRTKPVGSLALFHQIDANQRLTGNLSVRGQAFSSETAVSLMGGYQAAF